MRRPHRRTLALTFAALAPLLGATTGLAQEREARLDPITIERGALTFRATGQDPSAPRSLVLWRFEGGTFRRLDSVRSDESGRFDFGARPIPLREGSFHVAPEEAPPSQTHAVRIERPLPRPRVLTSGDDPLAIELAPALFSGAFEFRDAESGRLLLRRIIEPDTRDSRVIDFRMTGLTHQTTRISIEQVLDDGRRSPALLWQLVEP